MRKNLTAWPSSTVPLQMLNCVTMPVSGPLPLAPCIWRTRTGGAVHGALKADDVLELEVESHPRCSSWRLQVEQKSVAKDAADVAETWHGVLLCVGRASHGLASWMNAFLVSVTALLVERGGVCVSR